MTEENTPEGQNPPEPPQRGGMRFQDENTTAREPSLAEQRARRQALVDEQHREAEERQNAEVARRKADTKRKVLIGTGVTVGLVGLVATYYAVAKPEEVVATCADANGNVVQDDNVCDEDYVNQHGGHMSGGFMFMPIPGGGYSSYRYNYGGSVAGGHVTGGSYSAPSNANVTTKSGKSVQRGGFGISGKSGGTGKSGGS